MVMNFMKPYTVTRPEKVDIFHVIRAILKTRFLIAQTHKARPFTSASETEKGLIFFHEIKKNKGISPGRVRSKSFFLSHL